MPCRRFDRDVPGDGEAGMSIHIDVDKALSAWVEGCRERLAQHTKGVVPGVEHVASDTHPDGLGEMCSAVIYAHYPPSNPRPPDLVVIDASGSLVIWFLQG